MKFSLRHQSTGKTYRYVSQIATTMFYGLCRKVYLHHMKGVPPDRPVLLAANHPTAFVDPCLLCTYLDPPIYNMTRGDVFRKPFFRRLMEEVNMFPVYRLRDGYAGRDRNDEVFEFCIDKMRSRRVVTIYVEGEHHLEKRVRPVQKGIARIAFAAYERHRQDDLQIIPAGCNYVYGDRARDEVMVNIGSPILVKDYWEEYGRDAAAAMQLLCSDVEKALSTVCFHVEEPEDDELAEQLLTLDRGNHPEPLLPVIVRHSGRFAREKAILDRLNALPAVGKNALRERSARYFDALEKAGLDDAALANPQRANLLWLLFFVAGFIPALIGWLGAWPVSRLSNYVAAAKVRKREFYSSVLMGVGFLAGVPYYFLLFLISLFTLNPFLIAIGLMLPLLGWFSLLYGDWWERWQAARRAAAHPDRAVLLELRRVAAG